MANKPAKSMRAANVDQLRALASPVRIEIVGVFQSHGPLAIRELAEKLGRPADGLYHHVRQLQNAKILRVAKTRRVGKRDEAVLELTAERFGHAEKPKTRSMKLAIVETAASALRLANREFRRAVLAEKARGDAKPSGQGGAPCTGARLSRQRSWLTDEDLREFQGMLEEQETFLKERMGRKQGRPFALTVALVPLLKRKRL
jgi:DNA-binding transcriptional ArsR family regulator